MKTDDGQEEDDGDNDADEEEEEEEEETTEQVQQQSKAGGGKGKGKGKSLKAKLRKERRAVRQAANQQLEEAQKVLDEVSSRWDALVGPAGLAFEVLANLVGGGGDQEEEVSLKWRHLYDNKLGSDVRGLDRHTGN